MDKNMFGWIKRRVVGSKKVLLPISLSLTLLFAGCTAGDPISENFYVTDIYGENAEFERFISSSTGLHLEEAVSGKLIGLNEEGDDIICTTAGTYYQYVNELYTPSSHSHNVGYNSDNHTLVIEYAGWYYISAVTTYSSNRNSAIVHVTFLKNGTPVTYSTMGSASKQAGIKTIIYCQNTPKTAVGDEWGIAFSSDQDGDILSIYHLNLQMTYLGYE